ncbi:hypothetical protein ALC57_06147 [Trachymyrmex cornetzi]|uniref:Uncharacterized protein n=1 Tax=Trachymyrmex cornetzi TaxID=471704 RepID=A0A195E8K4_9HYME|nr:hypothetical protein ALC57_06147 [Trachymyrmex cornetzi]
MIASFEKPSEIAREQMRMRARYACTLFTKRFSLPPPAKEMRFSDSAAFSCIFKGVPRANLSISNSAERVRRICENSIECNREDASFHRGPRKFYEARYRFILSFEKTDFVNDVLLLAGTR